MCMFGRKGGNAKEFKLVEFLLLADCHEGDVGREISMSPYGGVEYDEWEVGEVSGSFKSTWEFIPKEIVKVYVSGNEYIVEVI